MMVFLTVVGFRVGVIAFIGVIRVVWQFIISLLRTILLERLQ